MQDMVTTIRTRNESTFFLFHLVVQHCGILLICEKMSRTSSYSCILFSLFNYIWKKFFLEKSLEEKKLKLDAVLKDSSTRWLWEMAHVTMHRPAVYLREGLETMTSQYSFSDRKQSPSRWLELVYLI